MKCVWIFLTINIENMFNFQCVSKAFDGLLNTYMGGDASRVASATGIQKICGGMMIAGQKMPRDLSVIIKFFFNDRRVYLSIYSHFKYKQKLHGIV
jgi:hypothetical protein